LAGEELLTIANFFLTYTLLCISLKQIASVPSTYAPWIELI